MKIKKRNMTNIYKTFICTVFCLISKKDQAMSCTIPIAIGYRHISRNMACFSSCEASTVLFFNSLYP